MGPETPVDPKPCLLCLSGDIVPGVRATGDPTSAARCRHCHELDTCWWGTNAPRPQFCLQDGVTVSERTRYVMRNTRGPSLQVPPKQHSRCQGAVPGLLP